MKTESVANGPTLQEMLKKVQDEEKWCQTHILSYRKEWRTLETGNV